MRSPGASVLAAGLFLALAAAPAAAQYPIIKPPQSYGDPSLRSIKVGFTIPSLCDGAGEATDAWASSFLKAEGKPPAKRTLGEGEEEYELESDYSFAYARWAAMYSARSLMDGDPATAWVEAVAGPGIGELAIASLPGLEGIGIRSGFQRSAELFAKNARPRRVRVWLLASTRSDATEMDQVYLDVKALASLEVELADGMGWQPLPLPKASAPPPGDPERGGGLSWFAAVQILSVYPGSRWEDCCISDIGAMK
jgi:hypothetical protein